MLKKALFRSSLLIVFVIFCHFNTITSQDFMMQGWFWDYPKPTDPNGDPAMEPTWAKTLIGQAPVIGQAGFTYLWLPPMSRASFGSNSNGYDPKDLYDLGEFSQGATGFGFRQDIDNLVTALSSAGIEAVADVVYNHRDGGAPENNPAVKTYITQAYGNPDSENPYPSDRFRCVLPLGGSSGNGTGDYYIKIRSQTEHPRFFDKPYRIYLETNQVGWQGLPNSIEIEPNGGGDCGQPFNTVQLGRNTLANVDALGCKIDEFKITLNASDFDASGDFLYIYITNENGDYSDHRPIGIWNGSAGADVAGQLEYQTYTDFTNLPSGRGDMDYSAFRPTSPSNAYSETLSGSWNEMLFFYDYDQSTQVVRDSLFEWSDWLWEDVGIRGYRLDAVKQFETTFVGDLMDHLFATGKAPGMVVGEFFDFNPAALKSWIDAVYSSMDAGTQAAIKVRIFDFPLRAALKSACDEFGYDARNVFFSSLVDAVSADPFTVVTFVNNHDFRDGTQPVQNDPMLAYAYILTNNKIGLPCVFYPEYFGVDLTPEYPLVNLKAQIDQLIQLHQTYIFQSNQWDYLSRIGTPYNANFSGGFPNTTLLYQMSGGVGGKEVIVAINFAGEALDVYHQVNTANIPPSETFTEMTGNGITQTTTLNGSNEIRFQLPARSYGVWVQGNLILPAELLSFRVERQEEDAFLSWSSGVEEGLLEYAVERSANGIDFATIAQIESRGSNSSYSYTDPFLGAGTWYYRLRMVDRNGSFELSEIRSITIEKGFQDLQYFPNPAADEVHLVFQSTFTGTAEWSLRSITGQQVRSGTFAVTQGSNQHSLSLEDLSKGIYLLELSMPGKARETIKLVVSGL